MSKLVLVKHSLPTIDPGVPARDWRLSPAGVARCRSLADRLHEFRPPAIVSSTEPKAVETATLVAERLGIPVTVVDGLHEHDRRAAKLLGDAEFAQAVAALFAQPRSLVFGRETANEALARFDAAITRIVDATPGPDDIIVVSHGTVIALFVAAHSGTDGLSLWKRLGLPSFVVLDRADLRVERVAETIS